MDYESNILEKNVNSLVPSPWSLFKPVEKEKKRKKERIINVGKSPHGAMRQRTHQRVSYKPQGAETENKSK